MGDRRVVVLKFPAEYGGDLGLYTHWSGAEAVEIARDIATNRHFLNRLGDAQYAARIFVDQFTKDARDEETGYGLFPIPSGQRNESDESYNRVIVDLETGEVYTE